MITSLATIVFLVLHVVELTQHVDLFEARTTPVIAGHLAMVGSKERLLTYQVESGENIGYVV